MDASKIKTREDVAKFLKSLGKPGKNHPQKLKAIQKLEMKNRQGHGLHETLDSYKEY